MPNTQRNNDYGSYGALWVESAPHRGFPQLESDLSVDVAVVGGGIAGVSTAHILKQSGVRVAVIEARRVGQQVTGGSTVKVTSQHGLIYSRLKRSLGSDAARLYGEANEAGLAYIRNTVTEHGIDCDFESKSAYVISESGESIPDIKEEADTAAGFGLPSVYVDTAPLPFAIKGAVRFDSQAQFHPVKYTQALADKIPDDGSHVFEQTRVLDVEDGDRCRVVTSHGTISARHVVVATNLPILDRGGFFSKCFPQRHVALAAEIDEASAPDGMFITAETPSRSIRTYRMPDGRSVLIAVGGEFKTGHGDIEKEFSSLSEWVRERFDVSSFLCHWGNQDYTPMDQMPYVGSLIPGAERLWVATGFNAWGMTNGVLAGLVLRDRILDRPNPVAELFDATRVNPTVSAGKFLKENVHVGKEWVSERLHEPEQRAADLAAGEGAVALDENGEKVAAFRDPAGVLHELSPICTHMGCVVHWNAMETSWDCPCHGSRFSADGQVINGPAVKGLARKQTA